jgi:hypothetical protein
MREVYSCRHKGVATRKPRSDDLTHCQDFYNGQRAHCILSARWRLSLHCTNKLSYRPTKPKLIRVRRIVLTVLVVLLVLVVCVGVGVG